LEDKIKKLPEEIEAAIRAAAATTSAQPPSTSGLVRSSVNRIKHINIQKMVECNGKNKYRLKLETILCAIFENKQMK